MDRSCDNCFYQGTMWEHPNKCALLMLSYGMKPFPEERVCSAHITEEEHREKIKQQDREEREFEASRPTCECCGQYTDFPNNRPDYDPTASIRRHTRINSQCRAPES